MAWPIIHGTSNLPQLPGACGRGRPCVGINLAAGRRAIAWTDPIDAMLDADGQPQAASSKAADKADPGVDNARRCRIWPAVQRCSDAFDTKCPSSFARWPTSSERPGQLDKQPRQPAQVEGR